MSLSSFWGVSHLYISPSNRSDPFGPRHTLLALDVASGQILWTAQFGAACITDNGGAIRFATADACEGLNVTRRQESTHFAARAADGALLWQEQSEGDILDVTIAA